MRRLLALCVATFSFAALVAFPVAVSAQGVLDPLCKETPNATVCTENKNSQGQNAQSNKIYGRDGILTKVARLLAIIVGVASVIVITVAGIRYTLSNGDSSQTAGARNTIIYALVGLAIALLAQSIVVFVLNKL